MRDYEKGSPPTRRWNGAAWAVLPVVTVILGGKPAETSVLEVNWEALDLRILPPRPRANCVSD